VTTPSAAETSLVIVASTVNGADSVSADTVVLGVPLRRRIALAAGRAGFARSMVAAEGNGSVPAGSRIVLLPVNVVPQTGWLRELRQMPVAPETLYVDPSGTAVVETDQPDRVLKAAGHGLPVGELIAELGWTFPIVERAVSPQERFSIRARAEVGSAERWLLRSLIKANEGFMSRHVERRLSLALTRWLVRTPVTPNMITAVSVGIGLLGAPFFLSAEPRWQVIGALLFLTHSILDGCDGEIARLKFLESPRGAVLDFWGDNLVHQAIFACMAIGWSLSSHSGWPLVLGGLAVGGTLGAAVIAARRFIAGEALTGADRTLGRLVEAFSHRDFIYLIAALAAFGQAQWFIALAAAGTPLFLLLLLWVDRKHRTD
jgi:phosphatidylglycerophosphate synthase